MATTFLLIEKAYILLPVAPQSVQWPESFSSSAASSCGEHWICRIYGRRSVILPSKSGFHCKLHLAPESLPSIICPPRGGMLGKSLESNRASCKRATYATSTIERPSSDLPSKIGLRIRFFVYFYKNQASYTCLGHFTIQQWRSEEVERFRNTE